MLVGPSNHLKQIIQIELNRVKNPSCPEANQLVTYLQAWSRIWTQDCLEQIQLAVIVGLKFRAPELQVRHSNHSATLPRPVCIIYEKTKGQVPLVPLLEKHNIQAKEVYCFLSFCFFIESHNPPDTANFKARITDLLWLWNKRRMYGK